MKCIRLVEAEDGIGVRAVYFDGKQEVEVDLITFSEVALFRLTDSRFKRKPKPEKSATMKDEDFGEPVRQNTRRSEDSRLLYG